MNKQNRVKSKTTVCQSAPWLGKIRHLWIVFAALCCAGVSPAQVSFGHATPFNDDWRFALVGTDWRAPSGGNPAVEAVSRGQAASTADRERPTHAAPFDTSSARQPDFDDTKWRRLRLPHDWSVERPMSPQLYSCTGYLPGGVGWYRKHFTVGPGTRQQSDSHWWVYFEGIYNRAEVYLNGHLLGMRPNGYASVLYDMTPWLNREGDNVLAVRVDHSREADSRWYTGSGIYRPVWIV